MMRQRLFAESLGTALLVATVLGSGLMASSLSTGNQGVALLANTAATVAMLFVLIGLLGPLSGAHFNPLVTAALVLCRRHPARALLPYAAAQVLGAVLGAWLTNAMFERPWLQWATQVRAGTGLWLSELVATALLLLVVLRTPAPMAAARVAATIGAAYWFTASTSFANPAVTLGRMLSDGFAGIAPASVPAFVAAQVLGAGLALALHRVLAAPSFALEQAAGDHGH